MSCGRIARSFISVSIQCAAAIVWLWVGMILLDVAIRGESMYGFSFGWEVGAKVGAILWIVVGIMALREWR